MVRLKQLAVRILLGAMVIPLLIPSSASAEELGVTQPTSLDASQLSQSSGVGQVLPGITAQPGGGPNIAPAGGNLLDAATETEPLPALPVEATVTPPVQTQPQPLAVANSEPVVVSAFKITPNYGFDFVEIHNTTDAMTSLNGMRIDLLYSTNGPEVDYDCQISLHGYLRPGSYVTHATRSGIDGAYEVGGCPVTGTTLYDKEIQISRDGRIIELIRIAAGDMAETGPKQWERSGWTSTYRTGLLAKDFKSPVSARSVYTSTLYVPPPAPSLQFLEIFPRALACSSGDTSPVCRPYVKVKNTGSESIDLTQFRLRSGATTAQSSKYNTSILAGIIEPGEFGTIVAAADGSPLALNGEDGATWLEDAYGIQMYANTDTPYRDAELVAQQGKSWAYNAAENLWDWAIPSPDSEINNFDVPGKGVVAPTVSTLKPCADNQYRSSETNRCRLLDSASHGALSPCKDGQYRSEETNRCRSIALAAATVLKPCSDDQFRNPATGRCKKIASTDDLPQPCPTGKERNPLTNRCRNTVSTTLPQTAFAVEPIKQGAKSFMGWWALGGVSTAAAGYAAWEWRRELKQVIQKASSFVHSGK